MSCCLGVDAQTAAVGGFDGLAVGGWGLVVEGVYYVSQLKSMLLLAQNAIIKSFSSCPLLIYIYIFFFFFLHRFCRALKIIAGAILLAIVLVLTFYAVIFLLFNMA